MKLLIFHNYFSRIANEQKKNWIWQEQLFLISMHYFTCQQGARRRGGGGVEMSW